MNRNVESHFATAPTSIDVSRSQFDRSSSVKLTFDVGKLIPFYVDEVLPGDTFKIETSKVVRLQTLLTPLMDNMYLDTYWFFVPNRLVWDHWKEFCGENVANPYLQPVDYTVPQLHIEWSTRLSGQGSLADYMGIPPQACEDVTINALPFRGYGRIYEDWFKDQNLMQPLNLYTGDATITSSGNPQPGNTNVWNNPDYGYRVLEACKYHDYFTSCLPAPQSGPAVNIPTNGSLAPVGIGLGEHSGIVQGTGSKIEWIPSTGTSKYKLVRGSEDTSQTGHYNPQFLDYSDTTLATVRPANLYADTASSLGTINDLRIAFQVQKFYEKMNYGRRYIEILKSQFNVTSPDARLQRSEYLGGNRIPLNVNEVLNNSKSETAFLGDLGAMSRTVDVHEDFVHSFTEHGFVFGICVVRYDHTYGQGIDRMFWRKSPFDYYWPVFANIGEQAVLKREINYCASISPDIHVENSEVFGYQEAWADYRYKPNRVAGEMRPSEDLSRWLPWTLSDVYEEASASEHGPWLSADWIKEDKSNVDRVLSVQSSTANQVFADFYVKNICTRVMPMYSIPGLADHH